MKHFIGTRFNLKANNWKTTKNGETVLTDEWLKERFNLFESYCLPSVINQTNQLFTWYVFFDVDTPNFYKKKIQEISNRFKNFIPIYINSMNELNQVFINHIKNNIDKSDDFIITTRIDNDDILHKDFVKTIQKNFKPINKAVIDIRNGYQLSIRKNSIIVLNYSHPFNAFISLVENINTISTVYSKMHYGWKTSKDVFITKKKPLWIELVHQTNKANHTLNNLTKAYYFNQEDFGLKNCFNYQYKYGSIFYYNLKLKITKLINKIKEIFKIIFKLPKQTFRYIKNNLD